MITHAAFPKTLLYCFIGPPRRGTLFLMGWESVRMEGKTLLLNDKGSYVILYSEYLVYILRLAIV